MTEEEIKKLIEDRGGFYTISFWRNHPAGTEYNFDFHVATPKNLEEYKDTITSISPWILPKNGDVYFFDKDYTYAHISPSVYLEDPEYQDYY